MASANNTTNTEEIEAAFPPTKEDVNFLFEVLNEDSRQKGVADTPRLPFGFFIRDESKTRILAGCNGILIFGSIHVDQLWVDPEHQGKGYGSKLLTRVHELGKKENCAFASLCTMSFQAEEFYKKNGYVADFRRGGFTQGIEMIFLRRQL